MTFDLASPAGGYYVCKTEFIVGGRKIRHLGGQISSNQAAPGWTGEKYLKERHPQGGIIWQSFEPEDISLENIPGRDPQG